MQMLAMQFNKKTIPNYSHFFHLFFALFFVSSTCQIKAQNYGNEWIEPGVVHLKIKIAKDGVYRLSFLDAVDYFYTFQVNLDTIPASKLRLFCQGKQVPIYISGRNDGRFNFGDYIEFIGKKNDGAVDAEMYASPEEQTHPNHSLINDTNYYFLTYRNSGSPLRYTQFNAPLDLTYTKDFHRRTELLFESDDYDFGKGKLILPQYTHYSEYIKGEGYFTSRTLANGDTQNVALTKSIPSPEGIALGQPPILEFCTHAVTGWYGSNSHHLKYKIGPTLSSFRNLGDTILAGPTISTRKYILRHSDIGSQNTYLNYFGQKIPSVTFSEFGVGFIKLTYSKKFNLLDAVKYNFEDIAVPTSTFIRWQNYGVRIGQKNPIVLDETNLIRTIGSVNAVSREMTYMWPSTSKNGNVFISDTTEIEYLIGDNILSSTVYRDYSKMLNSVQYMLVSHDALRANRTYVDEYKAFWSNRYTTELFMIDTLYDVFSYGIKHPLALRHMAKYFYDKSSSQKPKFLMLLGRGYEIIHNRPPYLGPGTKHLQKYNFIPTWGYPASDVLLVAGIGAPGYASAINVGRVSAETPDDVKLYLQKLIAYVSTTFQPWQKEVLHLGGGINPAQSNQIRFILSGLSPRVTKSFFVGRVTAFTKTSSGTVDAEYKDRIIRELNKGLKLMTFLGHGSSSVSDIDIGIISNQWDYPWQNKNKYPICYFNGCSVGNPCTPVDKDYRSFGEKIVFGKDKGGIAFLGQTALSELYTVAAQMNKFYGSFFDSTENLTLGDVMNKTMLAYQNANEDFNRLACAQLLLHGDPAIPINMPRVPDYAISRASIIIDPPRPHAFLDSFRIGVIIQNNGRLDDKPISVSIERRFVNNLVKRRYTVFHKQNTFVDTAWISIKSKDEQSIGLNIFVASINQERNPVEFTYANNRDSNSFEFEGNGINCILPSRFDIIGKDTVTLVAQASDLITEQRYNFELDTTPYFNSPLLRKYNNIFARVLGKVNVKLPLLKDTTPYFWRASLVNPTTGAGSWDYGSFTYIKNHVHGWMQNNYHQMRNPVSRNALNDVIVDSLNWDYSNVFKKLYIDCQYLSNSKKGVKEGGFDALDLNNGVQSSSGLVAIIWDGKKLERKPVDINVIQPTSANGRLWRTFGNSDDYLIYYDYNMTDANSRQQFVKLINTVEPGDYVSIYTRSFSSADIWEPNVFAALNSIGSHLFDSVHKRTADAMFVCLGKKGADSCDEAVTFGGYTSLETEMVGKAFEGTIASEPIGPTSAYGSAFFHHNKAYTSSEKDRVTYSIFGIEGSGTISPIKQKQTAPIVDLSSIDTKKYRFIFLRSLLQDSGKHTTPKQLNWRVTFNEPPEGSIYTLASLGYRFHKDTLYEGDTFKIAVPFRNIDKIPFTDSLDMEYTLSNKINPNIVLQKGKLKFGALKPGEQFIFTLSQPTVGLNGMYEFIMSVNSGFAQPEKTLINNSRVFNFYVVKDKVNPLLDVTVDGRHIIDGEIVSANPFILATSKDENKFLWQTDTAKMEVWLQPPGSSNYQKIQFGGDLLYFAANGSDNKARIEYRPKDLANGLYKLKIQSTDVSNNKAGQFEYEISFNVVREQTVTRFYPYPNPFTTSMQFVFTLTGTEVPDDIRIKITNIEGRVVKEVSKEELGNIRIGNNRTDWTWDGTDQFGDKLANGPYFYRVIVRNNGQSVKLRETKGDSSFKEEVGVIYLMR